MEGLLATAVSAEKHPQMLRTEFEALSHGANGLEEACKQFEALFLSSLVQQVTRPAEGKGLLGDGPGSEVLNGLVEQTLSEQIAKSGGVGVAERMIESFQDHEAAVRAAQETDSKGTS